MTSGPALGGPVEEEFVPISIDEGVTLQAEAATDKAAVLRSRPVTYLLQSALAGAYVGVAVVLLLMVGASFIKAESVATKLVEGGVFGIALTLVVFAGAELFTGVVMTMIYGLARAKTKITDLLAVWVAALVGNFVGAAVFSGIVAASGVAGVVSPKHVASVYLAALGGILKGKVALSGVQLFWRAVLCNFLVCLGLWMAQRATSDAAKLICLWWALLAFIAAGYEHSIANMTIFMLGIFTHASHATAAAMFHNLMFTVPGNIVGGGLMVAGVYGLPAGHKVATHVVMDAPVAVPAVELAETG